MEDKEGRGDIEILKKKISAHPLYALLLQTHVECLKVGMGDEEEIERIDLHEAYTPMGPYPELDKFMEEYCMSLMGLKEAMKEPMQECTTFINVINSQLNDLTHTPLITSMSLEKEEEHSKEWSCRPQKKAFLLSMIKKELLNQYGGSKETLREQLSMQRCNGKLPKDCTKKLLDWWKSHLSWPYPAEEEKIGLAESTGLTMKQVNGWFINQRKRHWKGQQH